MPNWVFDWTGAVLVVVSLVYLIRKHLWYWHFSNASLLPYFVLFVVTRQYMLAGLQVSYLIFGVHGLYLWHLEQRRDQHGERFNERFWYNLGWVLTLLIFAYTISVTSFGGIWEWLQFAIVSASLIANWATTRKWLWSWYLWISVNLLQIVYFAQFELWALFGLQFILIALSLKGAIEWARDRQRQGLPVHV
ncbi:nicotinamide mononucleotide transporter family protein [Parachitinimonas caeni]|uniref:Nicotinamide mononucleotide transporter family protein n=1 Tax=Parachitinimonas caeni TaxID=3031301 RepID=A0ABT7DX42_9NEIS|nr:nicotinamide mononucleotide transporter family protein [Parachitinimonas caeni]MDK2123653.1 nicotinamide mononucleotide transporter family protein [Parachitinimonas caeni]